MGDKEKEEQEELCPACREPSHTEITMCEIDQLKAAWGALCLVTERMHEADTDMWVDGGPMTWIDDVTKCAGQSLGELWQTLEDRRLDRERCGKR